MLASFLVPHLYPLRRKNARSSCKVITSCLLSTPIFLLHLEALLSSVRVTLARQSLSYFKCALRLLSFFPVAFFPIIILVPSSRKNYGDPFLVVITSTLTYSIYIQLLHHVGFTKRLK